MLSKALSEFNWEVMAKSEDRIATKTNNVLVYSF